MDWDDAVGISMPLYTLVDVLFELQSRGFFRRQARPRAADRQLASWQPRSRCRAGWFVRMRLRAHHSPVVAESG